MWFARKSESLVPGNAPANDPLPTFLPESVSGDKDGSESGVLKTLGWISAALGAVAVGLIVGRELRQRYKFNRRTPYDLYAHSGDRISELPDIEFGVGI